MDNIQNTIDARLDAALATSNYRLTLTNQLALAKLKMQETMVVPYNGGTFVADAQFLTYINGRIASGKEDLVVLDANENPIKIENVSAFCALLEAAHTEALNTYHLYYERVRKARTTANVIGA